MTENKRFKQSYVCGDFGLIDNAQAKGEQWIDLHSMGENGTKNVQICIDIMNDFADENEQLKSENKRLKRLTTQYHVIDIEKVLPAIAECKGITVEEYLEEIEEEYTKEGDLE